MYLRTLTILAFALFLNGLPDGFAQTEAQSAAAAPGGHSVIPDAVPPESEPGKNASVPSAASELEPAPEPETRTKDSADTRPSILDTIRENMGKIKTLEADFRQTKTLKRMKRALVITGHMAIESDRKFAWHVRTPIRYSCIIRENTLTQWDAETGKELSLDTTRHPALKFLSETMQQYFSGNLDGLLKHFDAETIPGQTNKLRLRPKKGAPPETFLSAIEYTFDDAHSTVTEAFILEQGGDTTRIEFSTIKTNQDIDPAQWNAKQTTD